MRTFLLVLTSIAIGVAAPVPRDNTRNNKDVLAVLAEMGIPDAYGKLSDPPATYAHDAITPDRIRETPNNYSFRIAILKAAKKVSDHGKYEYPTIIPALNGGFDKDELKKMQERLAVRMLEFEEALEILQNAEPLLEKETSDRWIAHYDLMVGWLTVELARSHEYNSAFGKMRIEVREMVLENGHDAWKFEPVAKMLSGRVNRDLAAEGVKRLTATAKRHQGTPWGDIARILAGKPYGVNIESTKMEKAK